MSENVEKRVGDMSLSELLDELVEKAQQTRTLGLSGLWWEFDKKRYEERKLYLARRIDECRDEIARRVGN